ncbi:hypothetical protein CHCC20375_3736 [Bacillus licheniformis]|nr:hypothetical protein CHCC20375_3736 [Bacillus licheniformis]
MVSPIFTIKLSGSSFEVNVWMIMKWQGSAVRKGGEGREGD